ncbi:putative DNA modification/repair radical SAM protein [Chitinophaga filiformis]|uniref:DNA modification/repair radical SAM protein n=1 Tax=Chitinophaga filiformis TaxID=104663 RepID=A0ABY4HTW5_CHIFI|nr:putative DNA modification/repair radical SAM protein [Chitinophaga filiformis]UPK66913.1 putative DNA modification/repair radical SAM protein [Chitinophaga filiformis]
MERIEEKLAILADAAKYDVSCASSGSDRKNDTKGLGNAAPGMGICHSYTPDGRCVSLLKILLTNVCIYDCAYCVSRKSNDVKRAAFTVQEVVDLTINFYRRNYIEGLFLSSGIFKDPDYTMERLVRVAKKLRTENNFNGYIHLKAIPGASDELIREAGLYADRLSVNLELPTEAGLKLLAPEKTRPAMIRPIRFLQHEVIRLEDERKVLKKVPTFIPAGQSTQVIVGAAGETDMEIVHMASHFYRQFQLKRVYYSGYVPISNDTRLPGIHSQVPLLRENRLYQADYLIRLYGFQAHELLNEGHPNLDTDIDPKLSWALRHLDCFPIDINKADKMLIARVPGIGLESARKICAARIHGALGWDQLKQMGVQINRAKYFITCKSRSLERKELAPEQLRQLLLTQSHSKWLKAHTAQLSLF